ncbi:unnamed protein product [Brassica rapa subsp. trilocularis]
MSYFEYAYKRYNEVRARTARAADDEVYERRSPDGDRILQGTGRQLATPSSKGPVASWRSCPARVRSPAGDPVLQGSGRQLATPSCKSSVASWRPRPARDWSPAGDPVLQGTGRLLVTQSRDGLVAIGLWRPDRMLVL